MRGWLDGRLLEPGAAALPLSERGFTLGDGLFETLRVVRGAPQHLRRHLARLEAGALLLQIALPPRPRLEQALAETLEANPGAGVLRLTLTRGSGGRGIEPDPAAAPTLAVVAALSPPLQPPARLLIAREVRRDEGSALSRIKAIPYLPSVLARLEARRRGADEALLANTAGRIAGAAVANLLALLPDGRVLTPPLEEGALPGTIRGLLLEAGLAEEAPLAPGLLAEARALLLVNSLGLRLAVLQEGELDPAAGRSLGRACAEAAELPPPALP